MMNDLENCTGSSTLLFPARKIFTTIVLFNIEKKDAPTQDEILKLLECSDDKVRCLTTIFYRFLMAR